MYYQNNITSIGELVALPDLTWGLIPHYYLASATNLKR